MARRGGGRVASNALGPLRLGEAPGRGERLLFRVFFRAGGDEGGRREGPGAAATRGGPRPWRAPSFSGLLPRRRRRGGPPGRRRGRCGARRGSVRSWDGGVYSAVGVDREAPDERNVVGQPVEGAVGVA